MIRDLYNISRFLAASILVRSSPTLTRIVVAESTHIFGYAFLYAL